MKSTPSDPANTRPRAPSIWGSTQKSIDRNQARLKRLQLLPEARAQEDVIALSKLPRRYTESLEPPPSGLCPDDLVFICRSMWNLQSKHLTTYTSVPFRWNSEVLAVQHGEDVLPREKTPGQILKLDIECLKNTMRVLKRLVQRKIPLLLLCVVHASTAAHEKRFAKYRAIARLVPEKFRKQIIFDVVDMSDYLNSVEAVRLVKRLAPHARAITASVDLRDRNFRFWKHCGFAGVGADISRDRRTEAEIIDDLEKFVAQAKKHKLHTYLRELDKYSLTIAAISAGFTFVEGAAVGGISDMDDPQLAAFNVENLYDDDNAKLEWIDC